MPVQFLPNTGTVVWKIGLSLSAVIHTKCNAHVSITDNFEMFLLSLHFCILIFQMCLRSDRTLYTFASDETAGGAASAVGIPCLWSVSCWLSIYGGIF